jgi:hypothetical protein
MVKQAGDAIRWLRTPPKERGPTPSPQDLANANLAYSFGWAPLLSDLWKLLSFAEAFAKKQKELQALASKGGSRRNVTLESLDDEASGSMLSYEGPNPILINASFKRSRSYKAWGSIRWKPLTLPGATFKPTDIDVWRTSLGLDITLSTIWEALPWSWLFDWYSTMGDYLSAYRNTVPVTFSNICIMRMWRNVSVVTPTSIPSGWSWAGGVVIYEHKTRVPTVQPTITAYMPFLGFKQLSILSSLLITRSSKV